MKKRNEGRRLELKRERLRQLTQLSTEDAGMVVGGGSDSGAGYMTPGQGRVRTQTCP